MLGWVNDFSSRETELLDRYSWYLAWYAQDDWKITPNLTLNLGLRWETDTPVTDKNNRTNSFDLQQINPVSKTPDAYRFGNAGRGIVRADGRTKFDFTFNKNFRIGDKKSVQFRGDLFNAFNHPNFALPSRVLDAAGFGAIGSATDPRTIQFGLRVSF